MNRNQKVKLARIELRVKPQDKDKIIRNAKKCDLSLSEYIIQRALGYSPKVIPPDAIFAFIRRMDELCNRCADRIDPETEEKLISLVNDLYAEFFVKIKERD